MQAYKVKHVGTNYQNYSSIKYFKNTFNNKKKGIICSYKFRLGCMRTKHIVQLLTDLVNIPLKHLSFGYNENGVWHIKAIARARVQCLRQLNGHNVLRIVDLVKNTEFNTNSNERRLIEFK